MAKKRPRRIEIQIYSNRTEQPGYFRFSPFRLLGWIVGIAVAVSGVLFFNPVRIWEQATDFRLWKLYTENMSIQRTLSKVKGAARNAESELDESSWLRQKVTQMAGIKPSQDSAPESPPDSKEISPIKNLLRIRQAHATFEKFRAELWKNPDRAESMPLLHPLRNHQRVSNRFSIIDDRFTGQSLPHRGIDFVAPEGDTVIATGGGLVSSVSTERGFGMVLKIRHSEKSESVYAHLSQTLVPVGRPVRKGQPIALVGKTGRATGAALHYEVRYAGQPINPEDYFITP